MRSRSLLFFLTFVFASCGEYEVLEIQKECQRRADSLFVSNKNALTKEFEKICDENEENYYKVALDSLRETRITDIKNLIEK